MQLRNLLLGLLFISTTTSAQEIKSKADIIVPGKNLYNSISKNIMNEFSSLDSSQAADANENGYVFVKFKVVNEHVKDIAFLQSGLAFIKNAIEKALINLKAEDITGFKSSADEIYILPVRYKFSINGGKFAGKTAKELLDKIPDIKQLKDQPSLISDFQSFIDVSSFNESIGVRCYFLTPLEVSRPVI